MFALNLMLVGCDWNESLCDEEVLPLESIDVPVTEADVWSAIAGFHPSVMDWASIPGLERGDDTADSGGRGVLTEPASVRIARTASPPQAVRYEGWSCPADVGLWMLVVVTTEIGEGRVSQTKSKAMEAYGSSLSEIHLQGGILGDNEVGATVDPAWVSDCFADFADEDFVETLDSTWFDLDGPLDALRGNISLGVDMSFRGRELYGVTTCADGTLR